MKIKSIRHIGREELLSGVKNTRLRGFGAPLVYEDATIELLSMNPADLVPAQRYVLKAGVRQVLELRDALLPCGIDIFALDGGVFIRTEDAFDEEIPVIPPIVEESREPDGRSVLLINDGIHRVYAARSRNLPITVVVARNVPAQYPYYAFALPNGWADVTELEELPDSFQKKEYRQPTNYKALFRDFNGIFPGVQKERKQSNPAHLRA